MKIWNLKDIARVCNGKILSGDENTLCENFSKDTRTIKQNDIYIGIKGEVFDGNKFYQQAFENGANACILETSYEENIELSDKPIVLVENAIEALKNLAEAKLKETNIPIVAVTGSVGKTSTKEMLYTIMSKKYNVLKTEGNENNEIGMPLTILKLKNHNALLLEMGMNHLGEISYLSKIAKPDIAVITTVTSAHIGLLGSIENILQAKLEIIDGLKQNGTLIINNDNEYLHNAQVNVDKLTCGIDSDSSYKAYDIKFNNGKVDYKVTIDNQETNFECDIKTKPFVINTLLAIAVGLKLGINLTDIQNALKELQITKGRLEVINLKDNITLINDAYNASIASIKNAIDYLNNSAKGRKIAILGDVFELGDYSQDIHKEIGEYASTNNVDYLITIGDEAKYIYESAIKNMNEQNVSYFKTKEESLEYINELLQPNDTIIIKASNAMGFKNIVEYIENNYKNN